MGIAGLLRCIEGRRVHVSKYKDMVAAIDGYSWLHKGLHACAAELGCGTPTRKHVDYFLSKVALLVSNGVTPLLVFDGGPLPAKADEEASRRQKRSAALAKAKQLTREGRDDEARKFYAAAIDVSPAMAKEVIDACVDAFGSKILYVVAPYEADAQLAFETRPGGRAAVAISEDSDLLCFGATTVLTKLDSTGSGEEISLDRDLFGASPSRGGTSERIDVRGWTLDRFQMMCAVAGCDYLSVKGIGIKGAHRLVQRHGTSPKHVARAVKFHLKVTPKDYETQLRRALLTFRHQTVYDVTNQKTVHLTPLASSENVDDLSFLGVPLPDAIATDIALARIDPITRLPFTGAASTTSVDRPVRPAAPRPPPPPQPRRLEAPPPPPQPRRLEAPPRPLGASTAVPGASAPRPPAVVPGAKPPRPPAVPGAPPNKKMRPAPRDDKPPRFKPFQIPRPVTRPVAIAANKENVEAKPKRKSWLPNVRKFDFLKFRGGSDDVPAEPNVDTTIDDDDDNVPLEPYGYEDDLAPPTQRTLSQVSQQPTWRHQTNQ